jgi:ABC-2 type transport system ATP-binding protein
MVAMSDRAIEQEDDQAPAVSNVVEVDQLTRRFGKKLALNDVSLTVPAGTVLGLVGENGAGKTTLIKHLLGLLKAQSGRVRVLGLDPVEKPVQVLSQIGYLSEEPELPGWMRVHELIRYVSAFYSGWDHAYAEQLRQEFALDPMTKVKALSKGQRARAGLLVALAYRPSLLLLDEPSSGLDPIVRRDILGAIVRTIADEGRTVIFSSHLLTEVERVSDRVAMIRAGKIEFCDSIERVKQSHARLTLRFEESRTAPPQLEGALAWEGSGREWTAIYAGRKADVISQTQALGAHIVDEHGLSLDEIFLARTGHRQPALQTSEVDQ